MNDYKRLKPQHCGFFSNVVNGLKTTDKSVNVSQCREAEIFGLKLISRSTDPNKNLYEFESCRHVQFLQPTHVRRNNFKCDVCFTNRLSEDFNRHNAQFVYRQGAQRLVIKPCGHTGLAVTASFEWCSECYENNLPIEARRKNLTYVGKSEKGGVYRLYKFNDCGHEQDINATCVPVGRFRCQQCKEDKYKETAAKAGLEYIGFAKNVKYECQRRLYRLPCGCLKELRMDHASAGSYLCENCEDSHYTKTSNVYLLKMQSSGFSWLKLGFAKDMRLRLNNYGHDGDCEVLVVRQFNTGLSAMRFEKAIHRKYKENRYPKTLMKKFLKHNGFTECYPTDLEQLLIKELNG